VSRGDVDVVAMVGVLVLMVHRFFRIGAVMRGRLDVGVGEVMWRVVGVMGL
jgi:hypothetical protein